MSDRWSRCIGDTHGVTEDEHVVPIDDEIGHDLMRNCWCQPFVEVSACGCHAMVIHRSADGREYHETPNPVHPPATRH